MTKKINYPAVFEKNTLRIDISRRGGGMEISLEAFGKKYAGQKMTAYQNYLGGGLLGSIGNDCTIKGWRDDSKLDNIAEELRKHFHTLTNPEDEFEGMSYERRQSLPISAY